MRVLIVDDSSFMRRVLKRLLEASGGIEVVATAANGREGLAMIERHRPDVVTLDIQMPELDGLGTLRELGRRGSAGPPVLVCSSLTAEGSHEALEAMRLGAADFITKDAVKASGADGSFRVELVEKLRAIAQAGHRRRSGLSVAGRVRGSDVAAVDLGGAEVTAVLIGSSTGGPPVLERMISAIPGPIGVPVVVAQHMPALFTRSLAERLDRMTRVPVRLGKHGDRVEPGMVYIAEGGLHTRVIRRGGGVTLDVSEEPKSAVYRPSVDELLRSAAAAYGRGARAFVLTGMGADGAEGARAMKAAGGRVYAQDEASSVVYGMPRAVVQVGAAAASLSIERLEAAAVSLGKGARAARAMA